jgi:hypothetical protein
VPPPAVSPLPEPEPTPIPSPTTSVDSRTQLLTDMARAFQMGMEPDDGTDAPSSFIISRDRCQCYLQVDWRRMQEEGQPEIEPEPPRERVRERERERDAAPMGMDVIYPQEASLSTSDQLSANASSDFSEELPALPPDDYEYPSGEDESEGHAHDEDDREPEEETVMALPPPPAVPSTSPSELPQPQQMPRRTIPDSERRAGGINWWCMYRFPHGTPATSP